MGDDPDRAFSDAVFAIAITLLVLDINAPEFYAVVMVVAILAPRVATWGYLVIAIVAVARVRSGTVSEQSVEASG